MVIYGLVTSPIVLGSKRDMCETCYFVGPHVIVRRVRWAEVFFIPVAPIWINHRLICTNCGAERKLGFRQVRQALSTGKLPLGPRPKFAEYAEQLWQNNERRPAESEFDPVEREKGRSGWNTYLKLWPVLVLAGVLALALWPKPPPAGPLAAPHDCWIDAEGFVAGCRMADGTMQGVPEGSPTTCFFIEPMPTGDVSFRCID